MNTRIAPIFSPSKNPLLELSFPCLNAPIKNAKKVIMNLEIVRKLPRKIFRKLNRLMKNVPNIKIPKEIPILIPNLFHICTINHLIKCMSI